MKLDSWPRSGLTERSGGQVSLANLPVPPSTGHKCHVISEEPSHEVEVDNINEMIVDNKRLDSTAFGDKIFQVDNCAVQNYNSDRSAQININNRNNMGGYRLWNNAEEHNETNSYTLTDRSNSFHNCNQRWDSTWNRDSSEIKSGLLVLIHSQNNLWNTTYSNVRSGLVSPSYHSERAPPCLRCPVHVQIHQKSFERYAIISRAGHQSPTASLYLKLKKSKVTRCSTNPCQFIVALDDSDGQSYRFEASTRHSADEWVKAFTSQVHNFPLKNKKAPEVFYGLEILPESPVENEESAVASHDTPVFASESSPKKRLCRQSSLTSSSRVMPTVSESLDEDDEECQSYLSGE
ncbi:hypothetical protein Btru_015616 [Bulinus truncatus]|nr:hypothetical protein Btru_015616 [Bulinus truncatus]